MTASDNPNQNRGSVVLAVTIAHIVASTIFVVLRLISRVGIVRKVSRDDYFIILAWVSTLSRLNPPPPPPQTKKTPARHVHIDRP